MRAIIIPILIFILTACEKAPVFEKFYDVGEETWCNQDIAEIVANIPDSGYYNIKLCLRHTSDYEMANLWCFVSTRSHAAEQLKDTVNIKVAEPDGRWLGKGGLVKTLEQGINRNPVMLPQGNVIFRIEQGMRIECLHGVKNIGIIIEQAE